ncbi:MAG: hydroxymethylglutaryl-CoA lyase [Alphaproteobacteria bacterium]
MRPVTILEVGPRDGLQNEQVEFSTDAKLNLINRAIAAGATRMEVCSFVHPKRVPQMADAEAVVSALPDDKAVQYIGLILNKRGYLRALETREGGKRGVDQVGAVVVATDTFGQKNQGQTIEEGIAETSGILRLAKQDGMSAQVTLSAAFGCPFEGEVPQARVVDIAKRLADAEPAEICVADTIGAGIPSEVTDLLGKLKDAIPGMPLRVHFHDTRHTGVANAWAAYEMGVDTIDASMGGLGGCPFAPKATGNVATEDVVYMLERAGVATGINLDVLIDGADWLQTILGRKTVAAVSQAGGFPAASAAE